MLINWIKFGSDFLLRSGDNDVKYHKNGGSNETFPF